MTTFRSLAFQILFYGNLVAQMLLFLPVLVLPRRVCWRIVKNWARSSLWLLEMVAGTKHRVTGRENVPEGAAIIASKHQSFWEVFALLFYLGEPAFILKKELMAIPVFGWYAKRLRMIPVDRSKRGAALPSLLEEVRKAAAEGRHIVIFPEGTRSAPGAAPNYRPGIHFLYSALELSVVPVALNSGLFWPRQALRREPGTIRAEFLAPIPPGLDRASFIEELRERVETRSAEFLRAAFAERPDLPMSDLVRSRLAGTS